MNRSDSLAKIAPALVKALSEIGGVSKNAKNTAFGGFKYATLENVIDSSKEHLTANGITVIQLPGDMEGGIQHLETILLHESGEFISGNFGIALGKVDPQGVGSAISYARRYALMAALNMPAVDDDGEAAMGRGAASQPQQTAITSASEGKDFWHCEGAGMSAFAAKKAGLDETHELMRHTIQEIGSRAGMREFIEANLPDIKKMPRSWRIELRNECEEKTFSEGETACVRGVPLDGSDSV